MTDYRLHTTELELEDPPALHPPPGYACLVSALARLYQLEGDISALARRGSGSACR